MKKSMWVSIGLIIALAAAGSIAYFAFIQNGNSPNNMPNNVPLSPVRDLEGTWKTTFPTKFYIKTDFNTVELADVGSEDRTMTWTITATSDENIVDVEVQFATSNRQLIPDSGYTPDVSPMYLKGYISGTRLTLETGGRTIGEFSFMTDSITGTWEDQWTLAYSQEVYTTTNSLTLAKQ